MLTLVLLLYLVTISIDAVHRVGGFPASVVGVIYLVVGCMYLVLLPGICISALQAGSGKITGGTSDG